MHKTAARITLVASLLLASASLAAAQSPELYSDMHWRDIGPTRAGRTRALDGVPSQPNVFYIGFDNGGLWRSSDYGSNWEPLFDDQPTGSIGAIAVAPSNPDIIYVGSGAGINQARSVHRGRDVQVHGRRSDMDTPGPPGHPDDRRCGGGPEGSRPPLRGGPGPPLRAQRGAGDLPVHGWREDLREGPLPGRVHERQRPRLRPVQPRHRLRGALGAAARVPGELGVRWVGGRHLQVDRRRDHVASAHGGPAQRDRGQPGGGSHEPEASLRHGGRRTAGGGRRGGAPEQEHDGDRGALQVHGRR